MAATSRLMVLMSPEEKAALDAKAKAAGISAGELMRRGAAAYEIGTEAEAAELRLMIDIFNQVHQETLEIADRSHEAVQKILGSASNIQKSGHRTRKTRISA